MGAVKGCLCGGGGCPRKAHPSVPLIPFYVNDRKYLPERKQDPKKSMCTIFHVWYTHEKAILYRGDSQDKTEYRSLWKYMIIENVTGDLNRFTSWFSVHVFRGGRRISSRANGNNSRPRENCSVCGDSGVFCGMR